MIDIISLGYGAIGTIALKLLYEKIRDNYINRKIQNITNSNNTISSKYTLTAKHFNILRNNRRRIRENLVYPICIPVPEITIQPDIQVNLVNQNRPVITVIDKPEKTDKPVKLKKARNKNRQPNFITLTKEEISDLKHLLGFDVFKKPTVIQLAYLKTNAIKKGIDDWISLIDSNLSYEENKLNFENSFGTLNSDNELMAKYDRYENMLNDPVYNQHIEVMAL